MNSKIHTLFLIVFCLSISLFGCSPNKSETNAQSSASTRYLESMDTVMQLTAYGENRDLALNAAVTEIRRLDALLSAENGNSEVSFLNRYGTATPSKDTFNLIQRSLDLYHETNGCFDITIYPLTRLWGFPTKEYRVPSEQELSSSLPFVKSDNIEIDESTGFVSIGSGQSIDLGGIAKGYTSQRVIDIFREYDVPYGLVSLGGNIQCLNTKPDGSKWKIGIRDPWSNEGGIIAILQVENKAVITSGGYERFFEDDITGKIYRHIIDPRTGYPAENGLESVTIVTEDGTLGDGLSTALYIMGLEQACTYWREHSTQFQAVFIHQDGTVYITEGLEDSYTCDAPVQIIPLIP